jgi:uncharacterized membrane protein YhaH (DUF805 family)
MLGFLFGFNARLGRLHFFLSIIALAGVSVAIDIALSPYSIHQLANGAKSPANPFAWPLIVPTVGFLLIKYTLKSMRIRDMGWDPVCVVPAWIALGIVDGVVASKFPAWSFGHGDHGTIVGATIQFALLLALTCWPSGGFESPTPTFGGAPQGPSQRSNATSLPAARTAHATGTGFGRRGS